MNNFEQLIFQQNPMVLKAWFKILALKTLCNYTYYNIHMYYAYVHTFRFRENFLKIFIFSWNSKNSQI